MSDRHQRAQRHVSVAAVSQMLGNGDEGPGGAGLEPDAPTDDLAEPVKAGLVACTEIERRRLVDEPASAFYETKLVGDLRGGHNTRSLASRVRPQRGPA